jgi:hypothetical protein
MNSTSSTMSKVISDSSSTTVTLQNIEPKILMMSGNVLTEHEFLQWAAEMKLILQSGNISEYNWYNALLWVEKAFTSKVKRSAFGKSANSAINSLRIQLQHLLSKVVSSGKGTGKRRKSNYLQHRRDELDSTINQIRFATTKALADREAQQNLQNAGNAQNAGNNAQAGQVAQLAQAGNMQLVPMQVPQDVDGIPEDNEYFLERARRVPIEADVTELEIDVLKALIYAEYPVPSNMDDQIRSLRGNAQPINARMRQEHQVRLIRGKLSARHIEINQKAVELDNIQDYVPPASMVLGDYNYGHSLQVIYEENGVQVTRTFTEEERVINCLYQLAMFVDSLQSFFELDRINFQDNLRKRNKQMAEKVDSTQLRFQIPELKKIIDTLALSDPRLGTDHAKIGQVASVLAASQFFIMGKFLADDLIARTRDRALQLLSQGTTSQYQGTYEVFMNQLTTYTQEIYTQMNNQNVKLQITHFKNQQENLNRRLYFWRNGIHFVKEEELNGISTLQRRPSTTSSTSGKKGFESSKERCLWAFQKGFEMHGKKGTKQHPASTCRYKKDFEELSKGNQGQSSQNKGDKHKRKQGEVTAPIEVPEEDNSDSDIENLYPKRQQTKRSGN